jgi:hypothetical protein
MSFGTVQAEKMTTESGYSLGAGNASSFKNRIINGNMAIDQRNAGASITPVNGGFFLDRFQYEASQSSKITSQQNQGAVTPPAGFVNYLGITSSSAYSLTSTDIFNIRQIIEGFNVADLGWGTANAKSVTLSFWVRSSLTGTFGGVVANGSSTRNYPFTYTISTANTWELETITIPGDTTGTWLTDNGRGVQVRFGLGVGSTYNGTAGAWTASDVYGATGATSVVSTNGATFYITGVQFEVGTVATSFDFRSIGTELFLCQRYYEAYTAIGNNNGICPINSDSTTTGRTVYAFKVQKRTNPTVAFGSPSSFLYQGAAINSAPTAIALATSSLFSIMFDLTAPSHIQWATANLLENAVAGTVLIGMSAEL